MYNQIYRTRLIKTIQGLHTENYQTLLREMKEIINKLEVMPLFMSQKINIERYQSPQINL